MIDKLENLLKDAEALLKPESVEMRRFRLVADFWPEAFKQQRAKAAYEPPTYDVHRLQPGEKPVVDGAPAEKFWAALPSLSLMDRLSGNPMPDAGKLKLAWDEKGLYALFESTSGAPKTDGSL